MIKLTFTDNSTFNLEDNTEEEVYKQMKREPNKRLYVFGVDFSKVIKAEVLK